MRCTLPMQIVWSLFPTLVMLGMLFASFNTLVISRVTVVRGMSIGISTASLLNSLISLNPQYSSANIKRSHNLPMGAFWKRRQLLGVGLRLCALGSEGMRYRSYRFRQASAIFCLALLSCATIPSMRGLCQHNILHWDG